MDFTNQRVVVTGGTRGLGRAATLAFLEAGATVHATYRGNDAAAEALRTDAGEAADRLHTHRCDVSSAAQVDALWEALGEESVEVLVNNAGIRRDAILPLMEQEAWDDVIATNLTGGYLMTRHAVKNMWASAMGAWSSSPPPRATWASRARRTTEPPRRGRSAWPAASARRWPPAASRSTA